MTVYEKNLQALSDKYTDMDKLIEEAKDNFKEEIEVKEERSVDGKVILKVKKNGRTCYLNGKRNTKEPAEMWVKSQKKLFPNAPIFIMGVGNWTYIEELIEQAENRVVIFVYEPSFHIFLYFLEHVDITPWLEKQLLIFWVNGLEGMDFEHMKPLIGRLLNYEVLNLSRHLIVPNYEVLFPEEALEFVRECHNIVVSEEVTRNTRIRFASSIAKNMFSNIRYVIDGYKTTQLVNIVPKGVPGILVAAGPSLNKNINELKKAKGKAFIIAVDTAVKPLLSAGIVPDMFAIIDAKKPLDLVKMEGSDQIPLVTTIVAASEVLSYHKGMKFFYNEGFLLFDKILLQYELEWGTVPCGGSVANSAFSLMYRIGIETIILVGQDLALTNGRTHADGTFHEKMEEYDTSECMTVEGNYEECVPTRPDFKIYIEWYENYIEGCQKEDPYFRVINATEGGAKIKHTEIMTLQKAIEQECKKEIDIQSFFASLKPMFHDEKSRKWVADYVCDIPKKCRVLKADAGKAIRLYKKLDKISNRKKADKKEYLNLLKKLKKQIQKIESQEIYDLASDVMTEAQYIMKNEQFMEYGTMQEEGVEIARKGILYMESVEKCAEFFEEYWNDLNKIEKEI